MIQSIKESATEKKMLHKPSYKIGGTFHTANAHGICAEGCAIGCRIGEGANKHGWNAEHP
jgi:hypothetical protein